MSKSYHLFKEIISLLEKYSDEKKDEPKDIKEFVLWLNEFMFKPDNAHENTSHSNDFNMEITYLLITQNKYFKAYTKKVLADSDITTSEEYSFIYHLTIVKSYRKMELIHLHMLEAPSGIEIIKRLLKKELIEEFDDIDDKRAKRVKVTEKGRREILKLHPMMQEVYSNMTANMNLNEKLNVISFLRRFNDFHINKLHSGK